MNKALVLIDFENEWINEDSDYYVGDILGILKKTKHLIDWCRKNNYKIIFTTHIETDSEEAFKEGTDRVEIMENLQKRDTDTLIEKHKISPFYKTKLDQELKGIEKVIVCGILTNVCVRSFVQDAYDRDLDITVITDCCVAFDEETQHFTFKDLKETREEIQFIEYAQFLKSKVS